MPSEDRKKNVNAIGLIAVITFFSRILGLIREMVIAALLGTSVYSDAFTIAFSIPNFFRRLFSEGILVSSFLPVFLSIKKKEGEQKALKFAGGFFWVLTLFSVLTCLAAILLASPIIRYFLAVGLVGTSLEMTAYLMKLMMFYILFISLSSICQGVLNAFSVFWVSSLTPVLLNAVVIVFALILSPMMDNPAAGLAIGVLVGGGVQLIFQIPFARQFGFRLMNGINWRDPELRKVGGLVIPAIFGLGVYQINILVGNSIASTLQTGSVSSLKFSSRLLELLIGIIVVSVTTVLLPKFSHQFANGKTDGIRRDLNDSLRLLGFISIPLAMGGFLLSTEIVSLLFARGHFHARSIELTAAAFRFHIIGLCFIAWNKVFLTCYQAAGLTRRTIQSGIIIILIHLLSALILAHYMGHEGIAAAASISQIIHTAILVFFLRGLFDNISRFSEVVRECGKSLISAIMMILLIYPVKNVLDKIDLSELISLLIIVFLGGIIYLFFSVLFKSKDLTTILKYIRKKNNPNSL
jgi:putative peptidoglycan lipid II flippase